MIMAFTEAAKMFTCIWRIYKKYAVRKLTEEELDGFTDELSLIYKKYHTPFCKDICLAISLEIERTVIHLQKVEKK